MALRVGNHAPDFTLTAVDGTTFHLADQLRQRPVVLFFYPKDLTHVCTIEACSFRDSYAEFRSLDVDVIGISADSSETHQRFATRHGLPMRLLTDTAGRVARAYGVRRTLGFIPGRATFVIDEDGTIRHRLVSQLNARRHSAAALEAVRAMEHRVSNSK